MTIRKILVAVDRSDRSQSVFNEAVSLAQKTEASLMLLHILSEEEAGYAQLPTYAYYPIMSDRDYDLYAEKLAEHKLRGLEFLRALTQEATDKGVSTEYSQLTGMPGRVICELASTWSANLIMVGSRGLKGIKEMFLGSVSNYVTHHAPCSVLIVRTTTDTTEEKSEKETIAVSEIS